jgi:hypothetical protein
MVTGESGAAGHERYYRTENIPPGSMVELTDGKKYCFLQKKEED